MPFEMVLQGSYSVPRRRQATALTVTLALHAAALCTAVVMGVWHVDELETPMLGVLLHQPQLPPRETASGGKQQTNRNTKARPPKRTPLVAATTPPMQPAATFTVEEPGEDSTGDAVGVVGVTANGTDGPTGKGDGLHDVDGIDEGVTTTPIIRPPTVAANTCVYCPQPHVPPALLSVSGNMRFIAKLCINAQGSVEKVSVLQGLSDAVTADSVRTLSAWRYQPYTVNGNPVPFCYVASFLFKSE
jgi:Gram-negative bacterial TonB protein C-terminal